jgi:hypothetical protein
MPFFSRESPRENEQVSVVDVRFDQGNILISLADGRELAVPLILFPRLYFASAAQRARFEIEQWGDVLHWEELDEDISVPVLLLKPEEVIYAMDEPRKRLLSNPRLRAEYERAKDKPISLRYATEA